MRWGAGHVSHATTRKNLFWILAIAAVVGFHGCAWLQFQDARDEQDRTEPDTNQIERLHH